MSVVAKLRTLSQNLTLSTFALWFFAFSFTIFAIQASDVFMYLALARDFLLKWDWNSTDPYLYTVTDTPLVWAHEYLSYALFYAAHALAGLPGLIFLKCLILALMFRVVLLFGPRSQNRSLLWMGLWVLAVIAASFRFVERSSAISDLFCILLTSWLLASSQVSRALLLRLTLLFFFWIQFHPGFPLGLALLTLWGVWHCFFTPGFQRRDLAWLLIPVGALFINPLGVNGVIYPFQFALNEAQVLKLHNFEWLPSYSRAFRFAPEILAFWVLGLACLSLFLRERVWRRLPAWFALFAFVAAVTGVRFVGWAAFALVLTVKPWATLKHVRIAWPLQAIALLLLLTIAGKNLLYGYNSSSGPRHPGVQLDPVFFPIGTLEFLRQKPIAGRLYNTQDFGAYMIWKNYRPVFHHGFVTDMEFYKNDVVGVFESQQRFLELAQKHGWTMLLLEKKNSYAYFWQILSPLPDWKIVAEDDGSYLIYRIP
ncbi:MAG: hypothetical protein KF799_05880 [Bdellovibrionales bacterium]|nr:hypothetical protein [Bdellovibrionales bacterium]